MKPADVKAIFNAYPPQVRKQMLALRQLVLATAGELPAVGEIEEALKWGEPAYLTSQTGSGSTVRLGFKPATPDQYRLLFHCQTKLVDTFRTLHPELNYEGNRAIVFRVEDKLPVDALRHCIELALTYHHWKRR